MANPTLQVGNKILFKGKRRSEKIIDIDEDIITVERKKGCCCNVTTVKETYSKNSIVDFESKGLLKYLQGN